MHLGCSEASDGRRLPASEVVKRLLEGIRLQEAIGKTKHHVHGGAVFPAGLPCNIAPRESGR